MMAVTGVILTYEAQLNQWARASYRATPSRGAAPLELDALVARAVNDLPAGATVTAVAVDADPRNPLVVQSEAGDRYVDRYTGDIRGDGNTRTWRFLRTTMYMHRWFALDGDVRIVGRTFTATANLGFLFLILSGAYLWWPRASTRLAWRQALWYRRGLRARARDFNWHSVTGFWAAMPLAVIVASGATMSYQWAGNLVFRVVGEVPPPGPIVTSAEPVMFGNVSADGADGARPSLDMIVIDAATRAPDWRSITLALSEDGLGPVRVTIDLGSGRQPALSEDVLYDPGTGDVIGQGGYPTYGRGLRIRRWLRYAHTGEVYGVVGQTVAGVVSLATALLVGTGMSMSWRRFVKRDRRE